MTPFALTRRSLLTGLAAATAAAAVPAATAAHPTESAELLALGEVLHSAIAEATEAQNELSRCIQTWAPHWPSPPEAIRSVEHCGVPALGLTGSEIHDAGGRAIRVATVAGLDDDIASIRKAMKRKRKDPSKPFYVYTRATEWGQGRNLTGWAIEADHLSDLRQIALVYEDDMARVLTVSDFAAKKERCAQAQAALRRTICQVMAERPDGIDGLLIQGQAMAAMNQLDALDKFHVSFNWGADFATSLIRIATAG